MVPENIATHLKNWTTDGENELLKVIRTEAIKVFSTPKTGEQTSAAESSSLPSLHEILYEIFDEFTSVATAKLFWKRLLAVAGDPVLLASISSSLGSVLLDVLVVQEGEASEVGNTERHTFLKELIQAGLKDSLVKNVDIVWRFSISSAAAILGVSEPNLSRSYRICFSKHFFTLPEYNLLREESEGYSKLIAYLLHADLENSGHTYANTITDIIGSFSLHPSRVLDIVLTSSGYHLDRYFASSHRTRTFDSYERALAPIRDYLAQSPRNHIYSLLSFHLKPSTSSSAAAPKQTPASTKPSESAKDNVSSKETTEDESSYGLPLSTCRILAMLICFGLVPLKPVLDLVAPQPTFSLPLENSDSQQNGKSETSTDPKVATDTNTKSEFLSSPHLQLFCALLEIPDPSPLGFLTDTTMIGSLGANTFQPHHFASKRVAAVFSSRLMDHFTPIFEPLSPANRLNALSPQRSSLPMPSMSEMAEALLEARPLLVAMGETISARLHHIVCTICTSLIDGILASSNSSPEPGQQPLHSGKEGLEKLIPYDVDSLSHSSLAALYSAIEEITTQVLLPSFVCLEINAHALWQLLHRFPYTTRYRMYHAWGKMMRNPKFSALTTIGTASRLKVKGMLKRMTDTSIKETGRPLCKWGNKFPVILADLVGSLVFPNFVQPLADSMRYLSDVSLDVLIFSCLDAIVNMPAGAHLSNVASFIACVFKAYYERLDIVPLIDVIEQLTRKTKLTGATLFTTLLSKMGCVDILEDTLSSQIRMLHSFPSLNTLAISGALQSKETSRSSIVPLRDRLWNSNSWLPLYILVLQLESHCVFHLETNDISAITGSYDTVQQLSLQLAEFTSIILHKYASQVNPSLLKSAGTIAQEYDVPFYGMLHLYRPILHLIYTDVAELIGNTNPMISYHNSVLSNSSSSEVAMMPGVSGETVPHPLSISLDRMLLLSDDLKFSRENHGKSIIGFPLNERLQAVLDARMPPPDPNAEYYVHKTDLEPIKDVFPLSNKFLAAFWGLRLVDVECNSSLYRQAMAKQSQLQQQGSVAKSVAHISESVLEKDLNAHSDHVAAVFERLKAQASSADWFVDLSEALSATSSSHMDVDNPSSDAQLKEILDGMDEAEKKRCIAMAFLQYCILPRAMISAEDALYCGSFIFLLHRLNPSPLWDTDIFLDCFFSMAPLVFSSTSTNESSRYGRLMCCILETIFAWREFDTWYNALGGRELPVSESIVAPIPTVPSNQPIITVSEGENIVSSTPAMDLDEASDATMLEVGGSEETGEVSPGDGDDASASPSALSVPTTPAPLSSSTEQSNQPSTTSNSTESILRNAHLSYCLRSIKWEHALLEHVMNGISKPVDRWTRRAIIFFLKETSAVFPTSERFCSLLSRTLKTHAAGSDDLKALSNSYQNLLESRAKTVMPHKQFQALFPGFVFPDAPVVEKPSHFPSSIEPTAESELRARTPSVLAAPQQAQTPAPTSEAKAPNTLSYPGELSTKVSKGRGAQITPAPTAKSESSSTAASSSTTDAADSKEKKDTEGQKHHMDSKGRGTSSFGGDRSNGSVQGGQGSGNTSSSGNNNFGGSGNDRHTNDQRRDFRDRDRDNRGDRHRDYSDSRPRDFRDGPPRDFRDRRDFRDGGDWNRDRFGGQDSRREPERYQRSSSSSSSTPKPQEEKPSSNQPNQDEGKSKKRGRSGSPEPPPPAAEKRQKTGESSSQAHPVTSSSSNKTESKSTGSDTKTPPSKDVVIGPPLPPSSHRGDRRDRRR